MSPWKWRQQMTQEAWEQRKRDRVRNRQRERARKQERDARGRFRSNYTPMANAGILGNALRAADANHVHPDVFAQVHNLGGHQYALNGIDVRQQPLGGGGGGDAMLISYRFQGLTQIQPMYQTYAGTTNTFINPTFYNTGQMNYQGTMMPISTQTDQIWTTWNNNTYMPYQNTYTPPDIIWNQWVTNVDMMNQQGMLDPNVMTIRAVREANEYLNQQQRQRTPEEIEAERVRLDQARHQMALQQAERERQHAAAREAQDKALQRALATFLEVLTPDQRKTYEREKCIYVRGSRGRRWKIDCQRGQSGNVHLLDHQGRKRVASFCVHPNYQPNGHLLPDPDAWMTQKLFLEHDEDHVVEVANVTFGQRPTRELIAA